MKKEFLAYDKVRNDALKLAKKILSDGFVPDIIYASLRGGAYMANVISEYFKLVLKNQKPVLYAAVVAHSYSNIHRHDAIRIDGWTYSPEYLRAGDKILLVDDIYDSGRTLNFLVQVLLEKGVPRKDIKVVVHDYKNFIYKASPAIKPDYYCRKFDIESPNDDLWIHYMSHELVGLTNDELENYYYKDDYELKDVFAFATE